MCTLKREKEDIKTLLAQPQKVTSPPGTKTRGLWRSLKIYTRSVAVRRTDNSDVYGGSLRAEPPSLGTTFHIPTLHGKGAQPPIQKHPTTAELKYHSTHLLNSSRLSPFALTILSATTGNFWHSFRMRGDAIRPIEGRHRPAGRSSQPMSWLFGWRGSGRKSSTRVYTSGHVRST